jgi:hypothetical protein
VYKTSTRFERSDHVVDLWRATARKCREPPVNWTGTVHYLVDGPAGPEPGTAAQYTTVWMLEDTALFIGMYGVQGLDFSSCPEVLNIAFYLDEGTWLSMVRLP